MTTIHKATLAALCIMLTARAQAALLGQSTTPTGAAFASACAGDQYFSGLGDPGAVAHGGMNDQYITCNASASAVGGSASVSASNSGVTFGNTYSNSASSSAAPGAIHIFATNTGSPGTPFPGGAGNAGWNDQLTWLGGTGTWMAPLLVDGTLGVSALGGSGRVQVAVYKNHSILQPYGSSANSDAYNLFLANNTTHNGSILYGWDYQMVAFGVVGDGTPADASLSVNRTLWFAIPVTTGETFEFGFYVNVEAGESGSGGSAIQSTTTVDFSNTLLWGGPGYLVLPDNSTNSVTLGSSASGFNYSLAAVPEPSSLGMFVLGIGGLGLLMRRARRSA